MLLHQLFNPKPPWPTRRNWVGLQRLHLKRGQYLERVCSGAFPRCSTVSRPFSLRSRSGRSCSAHCSSGLAMGVCSCCAPPGTRPPSLPAAEWMMHAGVAGCSSRLPAPQREPGARSAVQGTRCTAVPAPAAGQRLSPDPHTLKSTLAAIRPQEMWHSLPRERMGEFVFPGNNKNSTRLTNK